MRASFGPIPDSFAGIAMSQTCQVSENLSGLGAEIPVWAESIFQHSPAMIATPDPSGVWLHPPAPLAR